MSIFRPLNSDESNLFTIRNSFVWATAPVIGTVIADQTIPTNNTYLETPTFNNLPLNFKITYTSTGYFDIIYGKSFTTHPTILAVLRSSDATTTASTETLNAVIQKIDLEATPNARIGFRNSSGTLTTPPYGFELIIVGPIKVGITTGNSNKGWSVGSGNDPNNVYSYLNVGINTGNPSYALEVAGAATFRVNVVTITSDFNPTSSESGSTFILNSSGSTISILLPAPKIGLKFKFLTKVNGNNVTITSTSDDENSAPICYANIQAVNLSYSQTTLSSTLTITNGGTVGDWYECTCDGEVWYWTGISSNSTNSAALN